MDSIISEKFFKKGKSKPEELIANAIRLAPTEAALLVEDIFVRLEKKGLSPPALQHRRRLLDFWLRYSCLAIWEEEEDEYSYWTEVIEAQSCLAELELIALTIRALAGWSCDSREEFLATLREQFNRRVAELKNIICSECKGDING